MTAYLETRAILLLLFVYYTQSKVNLVRLVECRLHLHDLGEGLFGMLERAVPVVEYADAVPKPGVLCGR